MGCSFNHCTVSCYVCHGAERVECLRATYTGDTVHCYKKKRIIQNSNNPRPFIVYENYFLSTVFLPNALTFLSASFFINSWFWAGYRNDISVPSGLTLCTSWSISGRTFRIISEINKKNYNRILNYTNIKANYKNWILRWLPDWNVSFKLVTFAPASS